jgi:hypothetical protein
LLLYDRIASVLIGTTSAQTAVRVRGLRISFEVKKTRTKTPNTAKIDIYNLSEDTQNKIKESDGFVVLKAGYVTAGEEDLFRGNILHITRKLTPPDTVVTIEAQDGNTELNGKMVSLSFVDSVSAMTVLNTILTHFNLSRKSMSVLDVSDKQYIKGFTFTGLAKDALTKVTDYLGLEWAVQDNEFKLVPVNGADKYPVVLLTSDSGMLGSPSKIEDKKAGLAGWSVTSLLMPAVEPASRVALQSEFVQSGSVFTVHSIVHSGDTHGDTWQSKLELYNKVSQSSIVRQRASLSAVGVSGGSH